MAENLKGEGLCFPVKRKAEDVVRLEVLRSAVAVGIEDIEVGRFKTFNASEALRRYLQSHDGFSQLLTRRRVQFSGVKAPCFHQ